MTDIATYNSPRTFVLSFEDFAAKANDLGVGFWRGFVIGVLSSASLALPFIIG